MCYFNTAFFSSLTDFLMSESDLRCLSPEIIGGHDRFDTVLSNFGTGLILLLVNSQC